MEWIHDHLVGVLWPNIDPVSEKEYRDTRLLDSALSRPFHSAGGQDAYPTTIEKATALFHSLISNHPFQNGNKRTAVIAVDAFLMGNGFALALGNTAMYELAQRTASYTERGVSHQDAFSEIRQILNRFTIRLETLYREQVKDKSLSKIYALNIKLRRSVRRHPANTLISLDKHNSTPVN